VRARESDQGGRIASDVSEVVNKDTQTVVAAVTEQAKTLPNELY
jgi:hypothetical protein